MKNFLYGCAILALTTAPVFAQETFVQDAVMVAPVVQKLELNKDGSFSGKVYAKVASEETPVDAKVTLLKDGVVVDTVQTENGSFSFANIEPGSYTVTGATAGYTGGQTYQVGEYAGSGSNGAGLPLYSTSDVAFQSTPTYNAPIYNSPVSATTTYGSGGVVSGGGGGGAVSSGGFGGGRLLGRRFAGRRLLRAGLIGGVVAIAVSDDNDDDVSAAE